MSFQTNIAGFKSNFDVLTQQSASTSESWNDQVQRRFYEQFIDTLPTEMMAYLNGLNKLESSFENAEREIDGLQ